MSAADLRVVIDLLAWLAEYGINPDSITLPTQRAQPVHRN
jgi:hypothetical protein